VNATAIVVAVIGSGTALVISIFGAAWALGTRLGKIEAHGAALQERVTGIAGDVKELKGRLEVATTLAVTRRDVA